MTNQELHDHIKENIDSRLKTDEYVADKYVKEGYGQVRGGYFNVAHKKEKSISMETAEPSQKWHLIDSYYAQKISGGFDMQTKANLGRIMCPQLMLWIAEIAGLNKGLLKIAKESAVAYEKEYGTKDSRKIKTAVLKEALRWNSIVRIIKDADNWETVKKEVYKIT